MGFSFRWNMGWSFDTLSYFARDLVHRRWHHRELTFPLWWHFSENFVLPPAMMMSFMARVPCFRECQEIDLSSTPICDLYWRGLGRTRDGSSYSWELSLLRLENGNMTVNWNGSGLMMMRARAYRIWSRRSTDSTARCQLCGSATPTGGASSGSKWLTKHARIPRPFLRHSGGAGAPVACVANLSGVAYEAYRLGLPGPVAWFEILNTDDIRFGGRGRLNRDVRLEEIPAHGHSFSVAIALPPLTVLWFHAAS